MTRYRENRRTRPKQRSELEEGLAAQLTMFKVEGWVREYRFCAHQVGMGPGVRNRLLQHGVKDWRFDFAFPAAKLAVECEGGAFTQGRHTRGAGFQDDLQKYHTAATWGWFVYRCDSKLIQSAKAVRFIQDHLQVHRVFLKDLEQLQKQGG